MDPETFDAFFGAAKIKLKEAAMVSICEDLECDVRVYISKEVEAKGLLFGE